jgi:hypothetical protein
VRHISLLDAGEPRRVTSKEPPSHPFRLS